MASDNHKFVLLGPDAGDVPSHWDRQQWQWVEGADGNQPSPSCVYTEAELDFPLRELPLGWIDLVCLETGHSFIFPYAG